MKKDTFYFSHDYNAHNDVKILFMRQQLGMEGYGIYWFLIESLADAGGFLPLKIIPVLAMQMHTTEVKVKALIENFDLFQITDNQFFSVRLISHLNVRNTLSENGKKGALARWNKEENGGANGVAIGVAIGVANAKERKGKEIKGNESKEKFLVDLPFKNSEFESAWNDWKEYKQSQHKFKFKSQKSEQTALNQLSELSKNSSDIAIKIINQSIANGWKGFFELKNLNNGNNKKQTGVEQLLAKAKLDFQTYSGGKADC